MVASALSEDSIATRTIAVQAALERAAPPIAWLVGGRDKGADLAPLREAARGRVKTVIAFGEVVRERRPQPSAPHDHDVHHRTLTPPVHAVALLTRRA